MSYNSVKRYIFYQLQGKDEKFTHRDLELIEFLPMEIPTFTNAVQSPIAHMELGELNFFNQKRENTKQKRKNSIYSSQKDTASKTIIMGANKL